MNARAALVIVTLLVFSLSGWAQSQHDPFGSNANKSITVIVRTAKDAAAPDVRVEARSLTNGQIAGSGYTNAAGMVELQNLPAGAYEVIATVGLNEVHERTESRMGDSTVTLRVPAQANANVGNSTTVSVAQFKVPGKARAEFKKAEEALSKRKIDECKMHLAKALEIHPNFAEALTLRGVLAMDDQNTDAAINDLDAAIKADGSYSLAYVAMGATYNMMSKFDDAIRVLGRGISMAPNSWQGYFEMGKAQVGQASYAAAVRTLDKAQSIAPDNYALIHLVKAHALLGLKDYTTAMGELQAFLEKSPKDGRQAEDARNLLGKVQAFTASAQPH